MSEEKMKIQNNLVDMEWREWENSHSRVITMIKEKKKKIGKDKQVLWR